MDIRNRRQQVHVVCTLILGVVAAACNGDDITNPLAEDRRVTLEDEQWQSVGAEHPYGYEWMYFDIQAEDGTTIAISLHGPNAFDPSLAAHGALGAADGENHVGVLVQVSRPGEETIALADLSHNGQNGTPGPELLSFSANPFELEIRGDVSFGGPERTATVRRTTGDDDLPIYTVDVHLFDVAQQIEFRGNFELDSQVPGWKPDDGLVNYNPATGDFQKWVIPVPRAQATGQFTLTRADGGVIAEEITGTGYHDHNHGTVPLHGLNEGWYWSRAAAADSTLIAVRMYAPINFAPDSVALRSAILYIENDGNRIVDAVDYFGGEERIDYSAGNVLTSPLSGVDYPGEATFETQGHDGAAYNFRFDRPDSIWDGFPGYTRQEYQVHIAGNGAEKSASSVVECMDLVSFENWYNAQAEQIATAFGGAEMSSSYPLRLALAAATGILSTATISCVSGDQAGPEASVPSDQSSPENEGSAYREWTEGELANFRHRSTGGRLLPLDWFLALELPDSSTRWVDAPDTLWRSLGLVPDPNGGLPIGMATVNIDETYFSSFDLTGEFVGFNCSACHTGEVHDGGKTLLINGGSGRIDIERFIATLQRSLDQTASDWLTGDGKFWRFWSQVDTGNLLPQQLYLYLVAMAEILDEASATSGVAEGFGRSDTVSKGISAFAYFDERNRRSISAPVSIPSLWKTHLYDYRHYTGSIRQAMGRDISATVGGGAGVRLEPGENQFDSSVDLDGILFFEELAAVLAPPQWPKDVFGTVDRERAARGQDLYQDQCAGCHEGQWNGSELELSMVALEDIGTDDAAARVLAEGYVFADDMGLGELPAADAFAAVTGGILERKLDDMHVSDAERSRYTEGRDNVWRAPLAYKAIPLDGIWATPPYLHNGSVLSLAELLLPPEQRKTSFGLCTDTEYAPADVGLRSDDRESCFHFDASLPGNLNTGHDYGTTLSPTQRLDLLEFLKTL